MYRRKQDHDYTTTTLLNIESHVILGALSDFKLNSNHSYLIAEEF